MKGVVAVVSVAAASERSFVRLTHTSSALRQATFLPASITERITWSLQSRTKVPGGPSFHPFLFSRSNLDCIFEFEMYERKSHDLTLDRLSQEGWRPHYRSFVSIQRPNRHLQNRHPASRLQQWVHCPSHKRIQCLDGCRCMAIFFNFLKW